MAQLHVNTVERPRPKGKFRASMLFQGLKVAQVDQTTVFPHARLATGTRETEHLRNGCVVGTIG